MKRRNKMKRVVAAMLILCLCITGELTGINTVKAADSKISFDSGLQEAKAGGSYTYKLTLEKKARVGIRIRDMVQMEVCVKVFTGDDTAANPVFEETIPSYRWLLDYADNSYSSQVNPLLDVGSYTVQVTFEQETAYILTMNEEYDEQLDPDAELTPDINTDIDTGSGSGRKPGYGVDVTSEEWELYCQKARSDKSFANRCLDSMRTFPGAATGLKSLGWAYLAGPDGVVKESWLQGYAVYNMYAVDPDAEIQGKKLDTKWLPQDNNMYLKAIAEVHLQNSPEVSNKINRMPSNFQGTHREGAKFRIVDYDEEWVTVWDDGFQVWNSELGTYNAVVLHCAYGVDAYLETHPAGFYRFKREDVWVDFGLPANHPYKKGEKVPSAGTGVVTKMVNLRPVPNEEEKVYTPVYVLPRGTKLNVVSTKLVASEAAGSTKKYYQVSFDGTDGKSGPQRTTIAEFEQSGKVGLQNNTVYYMAYNAPGLYYVDSRFLNFTKKGTKEQENEVPGEITNVKSNGTVYIYKSKDTESEKLGVVTKGVEINMIPSQSDEKWTAVLFSGETTYVQTKYIKLGKYKVTNISKLCVADIVDEDWVMTWNPGKNIIDYAVEISYGPYTSKKREVLWKDAHYKDTKIVVDKKYKHNTKTVYVTVRANTKNNNQGKALSVFLPKTVTGKNGIKASRITLGKNKIEFNNFSGKKSSLQYSTDKNFKNAKIVENPVKKNGVVTSYSFVKEITNLKPDTTYYICYRTKKKVKTLAGERWISGVWSEPFKIKTKK